MYTSLKLSKLLADNGCELESKMTWSEMTSTIECTTILSNDFLAQHQHLNQGELTTAYDILNDICVKYAKEFFGKNNRYRFGDEKVNKTEAILNLIQDNKIQEAEDYIWKHCKFNSLNK